jgi:glycosyltransferase involved in cell wall biosynthesis
LIRVLHVITGLRTGGAEMMLYKLVSRTNRNDFGHEVVSLGESGPIGSKIASLGIRVSSLGMRRRPSGVLAGTAILTVRVVRNRPDIVQTWMYHADLLGGIAARLARRVAVVWNVQASDLDSRHIRRSTIWTARACAKASGLLPDRILCCAESVREIHAALGYQRNRMQVIHNGFDVDEFRPDGLAREALRKELGLPSGSLLIGMVARFDPMKDHRTFVEAASVLNRERVDVAYVLCGDGVTWDNRQLSGWIENAGLRARFYLLGRRDDMPRICAALDVASLCSFYGEGLPNVIGEAMACGVPCVVTDVGGCASLVDGTGLVVSARNPAGLAGAWRQLLDMAAEQRRRMGSAARCRIEQTFGIGRVVAEYEAVYRELVAR